MQSAVECLIDNLMINGLIRLTKEQHSLYKELTDLAKQIEKERDFQFFKAGQDSMEEGGKSFDQLYQIDQFGDANKMVKLCPYFCYVVCECEDVKKCIAKENEKKLNNNIK